MTLLIFSLKKKCYERVEPFWLISSKFFDTSGPTTMGSLDPWQVWYAIQFFLSFFEKVCYLSPSLQWNNDNLATVYLVERLTVSSEILLEYPKKIKLVFGNELKVLFFHRSKFFHIYILKSCPTIRHVFFHLWCDRRK